MNIQATQIVAVTPSDTVDNPAGPFYPMVGTTGNYKVTLANDSDALGTVLPLTAGVIYPMYVKRVWLTGIGGTMYGFQSVMGPY